MGFFWAVLQIIPTMFLSHPTGSVQGITNAVTAFLVVCPMIVAWECGEVFLIQCWVNVAFTPTQKPKKQNHERSDIQQRKYHHETERNFTGIGQDYEIPTAPEIMVDSEQYNIEQCVQTILNFLDKNNILEIN